MYDRAETFPRALCNLHGILLVMGMNSQYELNGVSVCVCVTKGGSASLPREKVMTVALKENHYK